MYIEKIEQLLSKVRSNNLKIDLVELYVQRICDYYTSIIFSQNRMTIMSLFDSDPDSERYAESEEIHRELANEAIKDLNDLFVDNGFEPLYNGDVDNIGELQMLAKDLSFEFYQRRRDQHNNVL